MLPVRTEGGAADRLRLRRVARVVAASLLLGLAGVAVPSSDAADVMATAMTGSVLAAPSRAAVPEDSVTLPRAGRLMVVGGPEGTSQHWLVDFYADGSHVRRAASKPDVELFSVDYSPDGRSIVVNGDRENSLSQGQIYRADADGGNWRQLTRGSVDWSATWSPGGRRVAFVRLYRLYVMRADGTHLRRVAGLQQPETVSVDWGPDGRLVFGSWLDYETQTELDRPDLWSARPDGSGLRRLTDTPLAAEYAPDASRDGTRIAYEYRPDGGGDTTVHVMDADGTNDREVVAGAAPEWSPDGEWIAHSASAPGTYSAVGFTRPDGTESRMVILDNAFPGTARLRTNLSMAWQPWPGRMQSGIRGIEGRRRDGRTILSGRVDPSLPEQRLIATLRAPDGDGGRTVMAVRDKLTGGDGEFWLAFPTPHRRSCKVTLHYTGDARYLPSIKGFELPC